MHLNEYQEKALKTKWWGDVDPSSLFYCSLQLSSEAGEISGKIAKLIHKAGGADIGMTAEQRIELMKELGDVLWFVAGLAENLQTTLESIAVLNLDKLASRKERGVILGEGDNR